MQFKNYKSKRRFFQIITSLFIILLPFLNILRLDIPTLRFYFLSHALWIDEFFILFLITMLVIWFIVISAMIYGRLWCSYMCPQIALSELVKWYESKIKRKLKSFKPANEKFQKILFYPVYFSGLASLSFFISFNLIGYFIDPYRMLSQLVSGTMEPVTGAIVLGTSILIFLDFFVWREKFCIKACPYGMMQLVVADKKTQIVKFDTDRNQECKNCLLCVKGCMMGIDIRNSSYQSECIQCGDCIDACTVKLKKSHKPSLITYSWGQENTKLRWFEKFGLVDGKRFFLMAISLAYIFTLIMVIKNHQPLSLSITNDRFSLYKIGKNGNIYNHYNLKIINRGIHDSNFLLNWSGRSKNPIKGMDLHLKKNPIFIKSRETLMMEFSVSSRAEKLKPGPNQFMLELVDNERPEVRIETPIVFFTPQNMPGLENYVHE